MAAAQWNERLVASLAQSRKVYGGNFMQLATVGLDGRPKVRTVVFRGYVDRAIMFTTNLFSEKVGQARANPHGQVVWWFSKSREQYRISGTLQVVDAAETNAELASARVKHWKELSDPAREQFYWPRPGSMVPAGMSKFQDLLEAPLPEGGREPDAPEGKTKGKVLPPPESFVLMLLWPEEVHYLPLNGEPAQLDMRDAASGQWRSQRIVP